MTRTRQALCVFYLLVAVGALVTTWGQNIQHFSEGRGFPLQYLQDVTVTPAARSFAVDLRFCCLPEWA